MNMKRERGVSKNKGMGVSKFVFKDWATHCMI